MELAINRGLICQVDDDVVLPNRPSANRKGHCSIRVDGVRVGLHRWLMDCRPGDGIIVDHIDRNPLNNRRSNLRRTTRSGDRQNMTTRRGGAYPSRGRWQAKVKLHGIQYYLGSHVTEVQARTVVAAWKAEHFTEAPQR